MKRSKRLYAMLGILVVACIATFAVTQTKEEREQIKATGEIVLQVCVRRSAKSARPAKLSSGSA